MGMGFLPFGPIGRDQFWPNRDQLEGVPGSVRGVGWPCWDQCKKLEIRKAIAFLAIQMPSDLTPPVYSGRPGLPGGRGDTASKKVGE